MGLINNDALGRASCNEASTVEQEQLRSQAMVLPIGEPIGEQIRVLATPDRFAD